MRLEGKKVAVVGLGVSNLALARYLVEKGAQVTVLDRKPAEELGERWHALQALAARGGAGAIVRISLGPDYLEALREGFEMVFLTPGMPKGLSPVQEVRRQGAVISGEVPLFLELCPALVLGITGSAGKTTTTTLVARMLSASGYQVFLGGNIGRPLIDHVEEISPRDRVVLELSSFQLQLARRSPGVGVLLNLRPDHLDIHSSWEEYVEAKRNVYRHQGAGDWTVLNAGDEMVAKEAEQVRGGLAWFGEGPSPTRVGAWLQDGVLVYGGPGSDPVPVLPVERLRLVGRHNLHNALAAVAAAGLGGAAPEAMADVLSTFAGVEHRLERVGEVGGVVYVNDSIATTPDRAAAALRSFSGPLILIAGGYDKKLSFAPLVKEMAGRVRHLILLGATAERIREAVRSQMEASPPLIHQVGSLAAAVELARSLARPGDTVLLSPACASYDMFRNYEERGQMFKQLVRRLAEETAGRGGG